MTGAPAISIEDRVLVLAPTGRDAALAVRTLLAAGVNAEATRDVGALCLALAHGAGAVFVAEEALEGAALRALAAAVDAQEPWSDLPVVVLAGRPSGPEERGVRRLGVLGNVTVLDRPLRRATLVSVAQAALRARRRQYALRETLGQLRVAVQQRDEFLAVLGHELRNPLAAIGLALHQAGRGVAPERHVAVVVRQVRKLSRLVDDLLELSRVTAGKITLRPERVDLRGVVDACVEALAASAEVNGVSVSWRRGAEPVSVFGDPTRLDQIVSNIAANAVKYTPRGGHVAISVDVEGDDAVLRVQDDGIGLSRADIDRIFEPFVQAAGSRERAAGGLGLGLALVRQLVQLHDGSVTAESEGPDRGSRFVVRLRLARDAAEARAPARAASASSGRRAVLVIEDNDDVRDVFGEVLSAAGHDVRTAATGAAGLALAAERAPDVVFVDIGLPGMDGLEVGRRLRAQLGDAPMLVAVTGYGSAADRESTRAAGFDMHLTKPVDVGRVDEIIRGGRGPAVPAAGG